MEAVSKYPRAVRKDPKALRRCLREILERILPKKKEIGAPIWGVLPRLLTQCFLGALRFLFGFWPAPDLLGLLRAVSGALFGKPEKKVPESTQKVPE